MLPPEKRFYLLGKADHQQKNNFGFGDFFHLDSIAGRCKTRMDSIAMRGY